jgi:hypothetical protein
MVAAIIVDLVIQIMDVHVVKLEKQSQKILRNDQEQDAGLCYPKCTNSGYKGVGPVCWGNSCKGDFPYLCGALCVTDAQACSDITKAIVKDTFSVLLDIAEMIFAPGVGAGGWIGLVSDASGLSVNLLNDS